MLTDPELTGLIALKSIFPELTGCGSGYAGRAFAGGWYAAGLGGIIPGAPTGVGALGVCAGVAFRFCAAN
jgi:hypothetical protein